MASSISRLRSQLPIPVTLGGTGNGNTLGILASNVGWDTLTTPGEFFIPSATGTNVPLSGVNFVVKVINTANGLKQIAMLYGNTLTYSRSVVSGSWSAWYKSYDSTNIVGTVSQTGGAPTGAIIEYTAGAGGACIRYADGTQICSRTGTWSALVMTGAVGPLFSHSGNFLATLAYQKPFLAGTVPAISYGSFFSGWYGFIQQTQISGPTDWPSFKAFALASTTADVSYTLTAIGRWY
jgi:hypothetical protein